MKLSRHEMNMIRYDQMMAYERQAYLLGYRRLSGVDEAGRGPLAGPVVAAACILDPETPIYGLNDSKKLTPDARNRLYEQIIKQSSAWGTGLVEPGTIDEINIFEATCRAMREAVEKLAIGPDLLLVDAIKLTGVDLAVWPVIKGDALSVSIAAASILAKVTRDRLMEEYDRIYPEYGFGKHKGYGTKLHYDMIFRHGPCPIHRRSFLRSIQDKLDIPGKG